MECNSGKFLLGTALALSAAVLTDGNARAQSDPATTQTPSASDIVVTAQRRSQRLEEVPISIVAVDKEQLQNRNITSSLDIDKVAVGVKIGKTGAFINPTIRGISSGAIGVGQENNVALYMDGFYQPFQIAQNAPLPNVKQLTVLKGPQGTLYGRNATGGAILIETLDPSLKDVEGEFSASYGRFNDKMLSGFISAPISDKIGISLSGYLRDNDGWIRDISGRDTNPINQKSVRGKILFEPTDTLKIMAAIAYTRVSDYTGDSYTFFAHQLALANFPDTPIATGTYETSQSFQGAFTSKLMTYQLRADLDLGFATLSSYTQYLKEKDFLDYDLDGSPLDLFRNIQTYPADAFTQEFVLTSEMGKKLEWILGAMYYDADAAQDPSLALNSATGTYSATKGTLGSTAYSAYGELTWHATDALSITGGLRYTHEKRSHGFEQPLGTVVTPTAYKSWSSATPRAVIRYELGPRSNIYASYSQGFKSGTFNQGLPSTATVDPEKITAYEVGYKTASGGFRLSTSAFYYDYKNLQLSTLVTLPTGARSTLLQNAATSEIYGAEATVDYPATSQLNLHAAVAWTHARYKKFPGAQASAVIDTRVGPTVGGLNVSNFLQDWSGLRLIRSPDWTANASFDYTYPLPSGSIYLTGNVAYQSAQAPANDTLYQTIDAAGVVSAPGGYRYLQKGYALVGAQLGWRSENEKVKITLFGDNITNTKYRLQINGSVYGDYQVFGAPATYGVRVDYKL